MKHKTQLDQFLEILCFDTPILLYNKRKAFNVTTEQNAYGVNFNKIKTAEWPKGQVSFYKKKSSWATLKYIYLIQTLRSSHFKHRFLH